MAQSMEGMDFVINDLKKLFWNDFSLLFCIIDFQVNSDLNNITYNGTDHDQNIVLFLRKEVSYWILVSQQ